MEYPCKTHGSHDCPCLKSHEEAQAMLVLAIRRLGIPVSGRFDSRISWLERAGNELMLLIDLPYDDPKRVAATEEVRKLTARATVDPEYLAICLAHYNELAAWSQEAMRAIGTKKGS